MLCEFGSTWENLILTMMLLLAYGFILPFSSTAVIFRPQEARPKDHLAARSTVFCKLLGSFIHVSLACLFGCRFPTAEFYGFHTIQENNIAPSHYRMSSMFGRWPPNVGNRHSYVIPIVSAISRLVPQPPHASPHTPTHPHVYSCQDSPSHSRRRVAMPLTCIM